MESWRKALHSGQVIPACPLTLFENGRWSEQHQRAVLRYYVDAGAGGVAVGVHSTQFAIREPRHGLFEPLLRLAAETVDQWASTSGEEGRPATFVKISGVCGETVQAVAEAELAAEAGYHAGLLSLTALGNANEDQLLEHARQVAAVLPVVGFYLQPAVGGRVLPYSFWRRFAELDGVVAIKIAPFNRYYTWDVVRAVMESGRDDLALYTGNDDNIIADLLTPFRHRGKTRYIAGGLLGQWGVWTRRAVDVLKEIHSVREAGTVSSDWLTRNAALTDANAAIFDPAHQFAGCIPGIMEVLRRQGLSPSRRCLDPAEVLSPGQLEEIDRVTAAYPDSTDDEFVRQHLSRWLGQATPT